MKFINKTTTQLDNLLAKVNSDNYSPNSLMSNLVEITHRTPLYKFRLTNDEVIKFKDSVSLMFNDIETSIYFNRLNQRVPKSDGFFVLKEIFDKSNPNQYKYLGCQVRPITKADVKFTINLQKFILS